MSNSLTQGAGREKLGDEVDSQVLLVKPTVVEAHDVFVL